MKKTIMALAAVATMVACSKDDIVQEAPKTPIVFGQAFVDNSTRAIDGSYSGTNLPTAFKVWGTTQGDEPGSAVVHIFNDIEVSKSNTGGVGNTYFYNYDYVQYWILGNKYDFAALVNANGTIGLNSYMPATITDFTMDADDQKDLLYANSLNIIADDSNNEIGFTFDHMLSKVHFTVTNTILTNTTNNYYQYKVENVEITNAYNTATCAISTNPTNTFAWSGHKTDNVVEFGHISNADDNTDSSDAVEIGAEAKSTTDSKTSHKSCLLIPGKYTGATGELRNLTVSFDVTTLLNGTAIDKRVNVEKTANVTLEPGHAYNFVIELPAPGQQIKFTVEEVNEWVTDHNGDNNTDDDDDVTIP